MMRSEKKKEDKSTDDNVKELLNEEESTEGNTEQVKIVFSIQRVQLYHQWSDCVKIKLSVQCGNILKIFLFY